MLVLTTDANGQQVESLKMQTLGETSCASTISYLDAGVVFIGSSFGDSQLIRLNQDCDQQTGSYIEVSSSSYVSGLRWHHHTSCRISDLIRGSMDTLLRC